VVSIWLVPLVSSSLTLTGILRVTSRSGFFALSNALTQHHESAVLRLELLLLSASP
jgi:acetolactate synthase regulatory subunit